MLNGGLHSRNTPMTDRACTVQHQMNGQQIAEFSQPMNLTVEDSNATEIRSTEVSNAGTSTLKIIQQLEKQAARSGSGAN